MTESTHRNAACDLASAVWLPVTWYSRAVAIESHMTVSLLPLSPRTHV
jgi:hypothetical protein